MVNNSNNVSEREINYNAVLKSSYQININDLHVRGRIEAKSHNKRNIPSLVYYCIYKYHD